MVTNTMDMNTIIVEKTKCIHFLNNLLEDDQYNTCKKLKCYPKAIDVILEAVNTIDDFCGELINLKLDIADYYKAVSLLNGADHNGFVILTLSDVAVPKEKLNSVNKGLQSIGLRYEDMQHIIYAYTIMENYNWDDTCEHRFIIDVMHNALETKDINKIYKFIKTNDASIKYIRHNKKDKVFNETRYNKTANVLINILNNISMLTY